jgi:hypothetical protein
MNENGMTYGGLLGDKHPKAVLKAKNAGFFFFEIYT